MNISMEREAIVSATELVKNFASIRKKAKAGKENPQWRHLVKFH